MPRRRAAKGLGRRDEIPADREPPRRSLFSPVYRHPAGPAGSAVGFWGGGAKKVKGSVIESTLAIDSSFSRAGSRKNTTGHSAPSCGPRCCVEKQKQEILSKYPPDTSGITLKVA